ncbi:MAG: adenylate kinase family protein [Candidatus Woesearchaeota archaeon]
MKMKKKNMSILAKKIKKIIILGPQGSGKDTQAIKLSKRLKIPQFSMGELLRQRAKKHDRLGIKIEKLLKTGKLLPIEIVSDVLFERLKKKDCKNGFILNGYPRSLEQYKAIENKGITPDVVLLIDIPEKEIIKRLSKRMQCPKCGKPYVIENYNPKKPPLCNECKVPLVRRADDEPKAIKQRIKVYNQETKPVLKIYKKKGLLVKINGYQSIEDVHKEIMKKLLENSKMQHKS